MLKGILIGIGAILLLVVFVVVMRYQSDISKAQERIKSGQIIETACGPIEYGVKGEGPDVLVVHGAGGGFDQGLGAVQDWMGGGFRYISPSRFGYLRATLPVNASPAAQADAHACLLDALNISQVSVVGISAGALSSMQFAIRYPEKTSALILIVPDTWVPPDQAPAEEVMKKGFVADVVLRSDFIMWLFMKIDRKDMIAFLGVPEEMQSRLTPEENKKLSEFLLRLLPIHPRVNGMINDGNNHESKERYALENIKAPTLVIDAADVGTYNGSKYTSKNIPGAKFTGFESGGHLLIGHDEKVRSEVMAFLKEHSSSSQSRKGE